MSTVHFLLPAPAPTPIGGYKVVYEYANALVAAGTAAEIWHAPFFNAFSGGQLVWSRAALFGAGVVRRRLSSPAQPLVDWFDLDERVRQHLTATPPQPRLSPDDVVIATAVETTEYAARLARRAGALSLALIQHHETWAASPEVIRRAWKTVDERVVIAPWLQELCAEAGLSSVLLPNALDVESFPAGPGLSERRPMVLSLLSPHGYKRPDVVAGSLNRISERPGTRVVAFGIDSAPPVALSPGVEYIADPPPEMLRRLYRDAVVYLCGSDAEGWHLPPAEATLSGAAVVSTDIGGVRASMGEDALYAPAGDAGALATLAERVLADLDAAQERVDRASARLRAVTYADNTRRLLEIVDATRARAR